MAPLQDDIMKDKIIENMTPIQQFYKNKSIFLTGATGFLGKVIMEKLLRTCDVESIYVLIRSKKGKSVAFRCEEIFNDVVFDKLKRDYPKFRHKIIGISGDCSLPELGISATDRKCLIDNVNIVFHVAATVRFDEKLKLALSINVAGTREILVLCKEIDKLHAVVHVSTAYANCNRWDIGEKIYKPQMSGENAIKLGDCLDEKTLDSITPQIISKWPNTYTFTKCLAEDLVRTMGKGLPVTIFRPAIVIPTYLEPISGWIDNMYGPTGIIVGVGSGLLRVFHVCPENFAELVPVDMCVNALLASAWDVHHVTHNEPPVYNYVASPQNPITWRQYCDMGIESGRTMPMNNTIWFYSFTMTSSKFLSVVLTLLYHTIPAILMDAGLMAMGKKPKMLRMYRKIHKFCNAIGYFTTRRWHFTNHNVQTLYQKLEPADQKLFFFDMSNMKWMDVISLSIYGIRTYLLKEDPSTIPQALIRTKRLKLLHYATVYTIIGVVIYFIYKIFAHILF